VRIRDCPGHTIFFKLFSGVLEAEMASLSLMLYKLLTCHPLTVFLRRPSELMTRFIGLIFENIIKITGPAMRLALVYFIFFTFSLP
jgi:hypothetical protein